MDLRQFQSPKRRSMFRKKIYTIRLLFLFSLLYVFLIPQSFATEKLSEINIDDFVKIQKKEPKAETKDPFVHSKKVFSDSELNLFGIIYGKDIAGCLINDKILFVHDTIGNCTVISISKQRVLLKGVSGSIELTL